MTASSEKVRILLIRPWTEPLGPFRDALRDAGINASVVRVDIEPALNAVLSRIAFTIVVFDPVTPKLTREVVEERMREHRRTASIIAFDRFDVVVDAIRRALADLAN